MRLEFSYEFADVKEFYVSTNKGSWIKAGVILSFLVVAELGLLQLNRLATPPAVLGQPQQQPLSMSGYLIWVAIALALWMPINSFLRGGSVKRKYWDQNPGIRRPKIADVTAGGVVIADVVSRSEYRWTAFTRFREGKRGFFLYLSAYSALIFPKRVFSSPEEVNAFRNMARNLVHENPSSPGFAVGAGPGALNMAATTPPPLPEYSEGRVSGR